MLWRIFLVGDAGTTVRGWHAFASVARRRLRIFHLYVDARVDSGSRNSPAGRTTIDGGTQQASRSSGKEARRGAARPWRAICRRSVGRPPAFQVAELMRAGTAVCCIMTAAAAAPISNCRIWFRQTLSRRPADRPTAIRAATVDHSFGSPASSSPSSTRVI